MDRKAEIIIVGAGAAGLMAASRLVEHAQVLVLEARDRIGGRIHTVSDHFPFHIDAGAEFIHGDQPLTQEVIRQFGGQLISMEGRFYEKYDGQIYKGNDDKADWEIFMDKLKKISEDITMAEFLQHHFSADQYENLRKQVKSFAEGYDAADMSRVSAFALRDEWKNQDDEDQHRVRGGYSQLIHFLEEEVRAGGGEIILSCPVKKIRWSANGVTIITHTQMTYEAKKVIITVPLGVIQQKRIAFEPPLLQHDEAFRALGFGGVIKFFIEVTQDFWERVVQRSFPEFAFIFSDGIIPTWWSLSPETNPLLTGWLAGPDALGIDKDPKALLDKAVNSLAYILSCGPETILPEITHWFIADWVNDPYSLGAYTYATVASENAILLLSKPVEETVYFAGEAIYHGPAMGTVEAALQSGKRVSEMIKGKR